MIEKISEKLSKITKDVADSTHQQVEVMKMKSSIKKSETAIENAYKEIGKLFLDKAVSEIPEEYTEYMDDVRKAKAEISEWKEKIDHMKGMKFCKECGHKIKDNMNFCPSCGTKITELKASADTENNREEIRNEEE